MEFGSKGWKSMVMLLYRTLLRTHTQILGPSQRNLGDAMVKREFRMHRNVKNEAQAREFIRSWLQYLETLQTSDILPTIDPSRFTDSQLEKVSNIRKKILDGFRGGS